MPALIVPQGRDRPLVGVAYPVLQGMATGRGIEQAWLRVTRSERTLEPMATQRDDAVPGRNWQPGRRRPGAPENEIPVGVALNTVLARTSDLAMFVSDCWVYSTGLQFTVAARFRALGRQQIMHGLLGVGGAAERVLLGVEFADGRTGSTIPMTGGVSSVASDDQPQLIFGSGGSGSPYGSDVTLFLRPLPPAGPLALIVESPVLGISETRTQVATDAILTAATHVVELWPYEPPTDAGPVMLARDDLTPGGWFAAHYPDGG